MEKMKKLKAFRKRLLALVTSLLLFATMMPVNPTTVLAGEPLPPLALKKSFQKAEITWKSGRGSNAKFRIKLTVKKGTPEQVVPAEFYGAVGKTTNEAALRNNLNTFVTSEYPAVENADGSRTWTIDDFPLSWSSSFSQVKKGLSSIKSNASWSMASYGMKADASEEDKASAQQVLTEISNGAQDARNELDKETLDAGKVLSEVQDVKKAFEDNRELLENVVEESPFGYLEEGVCSAEMLQYLEENRTDEEKEEIAEAAETVKKDAEAAADAADALLTKLGGEDQEESVFVSTLAPKDEASSGTFTSCIGKYWLGLVNMKTKALSAAGKLNQTSVEGNAWKALGEAGDDLDGGYTSAQEECKDAVKALEEAKDLADDASKEKIEALLKEDESNPGDMTALKEQLDKTQDSYNGLEGAMGAGPKDTDTITVAVSLGPADTGDPDIWDAIVFIGEVTKGKTVTSLEPEEGQYTVTVNYVMGKNSKGETIKEPWSFNKQTVEVHDDGDEYAIISTDIAGYTCDKPVVEGKIEGANVEETVTYSCAHPEDEVEWRWGQYAAGGHWKYCKQCEDQITEREAHSTGKADYDFTKQGHTLHCHVCGFVDSAMTDMAHKKIYDEHGAKLLSQHHVTCEVCNYGGDEPHAWVPSNPDANYCSATCPCGATYVSSQHKFSKYESAANGQHYKICSICGWRELEDCNTNECAPKDSTHHYLVCSKCKRHVSEEAHVTECRHSHGDYHTEWCTKCKATIARNLPCKYGDGWSSTDAVHYKSCGECGNWVEGNHIYGSKKYNVNYHSDFVQVDGKLTTKWYWDVVKRCTVCGYEKKVSSGSSGGGGGHGGSSGGNKNFGGGAGGPKPKITSSDTTFDNTLNQPLNTNVVTDIDDLVADKYFELVPDEDHEGYDISALIEEKFGEGTAESDVSVVVEPTVTVTPTAYNGASRTLSIEIEAKYNIVLENKDGEKATIAEDQTIPVDESVELRVLLPDGFGSEGKQVNIKHTHKGVQYTYLGTIEREGDKYFLSFTSEHGFSPFTFTLVDEQGENDVASVAFGYKTSTGSAIYVTGYFDDISKAFDAASELDFKDQLPEGVQSDAQFAYEQPKVQLLRDVTLSGAANLGESIVLDLNGHTFTVTENGGINNVGTGEYPPEITLESTTPGTFTTSGTIHVPVGMWTGDTVNITGGLFSSGFSVDGGTLNITGGEVNFAGRMINNGGDADIKATISGDAKIRNMSYVVYLDENGDIMDGMHDCKLTLAGGYFDVDPESYKTGKRSDNSYDQSKYLELDEENIEAWDPVFGNGNWKADEDVYTWRIRRDGTEICEHTNTEIRDAFESTCLLPGYTGNKYCKDCGALIETGELIPALGHDYEVTYAWSEDGKSCVGTAVCKREGCTEETEGHTVTENAVVTSAVKTPATADTKGWTTYTAAFTNTAFTTQTKDLEDIPPTGGDTPAPEPGPEPSGNTRLFRISISGNAVAKDSTGTVVKEAREKQVITIEWTPKENDPDYLFDKWSLTGAVPKDESASKTTFVMPAGDVIVTAKEKLAVADQVIEELPENRNDADVKVTKLAFAKTKLTLRKSEGRLSSENNLLKAVAPSGAELPKIYFITDNKDVVAVDQSGNFYPMGVGSATVTAYCGNKKATCKVTVVNYTEELILRDENGNDVSEKELKMKAGEQLYLIADLKPYDSTDSRNVTWKSSNKNVTVKNGIITAKEIKGESSISATITASVKATNLETGKTNRTVAKTVTITVTPVSVPKANTADKTHKLALDKKAIKLRTTGTAAEGELVMTLTAKGSGLTAENLSITGVTSTNPAIVEAESTCVVTPDARKADKGTSSVKLTAKRAGIAWIVVTSRSTASKEGEYNCQLCKVTVTSPATSVAIESGTLKVSKGDDDKKTITMRKGQSGTVEIVVSPEFTTDFGKVKLSGSGGISVKNGIITAKKVTQTAQGNKPATLKVRCGNLNETVYVTVTK